MPEDVAILIDGKKWRYWEDLEIQLSLDNFSTISFTAPFEAERKEFRETFRPFTYKPLDVTVNDVLLFKGTLVGVEPKIEPNSRTVVCSGYSLPGVLSDSTAPPEAYPLEFRGLTLKQIAEKLASYFSLSVVTDEPHGTPFKKVALEPDQNISEFLGDLARQRGMVMNNTPDGALQLLRSMAKGTPVARLKQGVPPTGVSVAATFSPQSYYSEITGIAKTKAGKAGGAYLLKNSRLPNVKRPHTFQLDDTDFGDLPSAVAAKVARMFGNMISFVVEVPTWRDPFDDLWKPNTLVSLLAEDCMVYNETKFLIRDVILKAPNDAQTASLGLVLPGSFSGDIPNFLPWES